MSTPTVGRWSRRWRAPAAKLGLAAALAAAASSLQAAHDGDRERRVAVRAGDQVLAREALLLDSEEHGLLLRMRDLTLRLPPDLPRPLPVRLHGELFLPLRPLEGFVRFDRRSGTLRFMSDAGPLMPAPFPPLAPVRDTGPVVEVTLPLPPPRSVPSAAIQVEELLPLGGAPAMPAWPEPAAGPAVAQPVAAAPVVAGEVVAGASPTGQRPGRIRRRDPLELPLLMEDEWREWLLRVELNGEVVSEGTVLLENQEGAFAARVVDLQAWRVLIDRAQIITVNGEAFYPLSAVPGLSRDFDPAELALTLVVPPSELETTRLAQGRPATIAPRAGRGGFIDYDVLFLAGDGLRSTLDALLEMGVFDKMGVLVSNFRLGDLTDDDRRAVRLETTFIKDFPGRRASLRLGDSLTAGGVLGRPVRFGGIQFSTNFATDPTFITFPLPAIGGLAEQPALAEVFLDNTRRLAEEVPPGPFEIDNLPVVTGAGEVQLRVTDLLGRERLITQDYYVSPRLLRAGLPDFSYALGFARQDFNQDSFAYGDPFVTGTQRYGFTDTLTGEAHLEAALERQAVGAGGAVLLGHLGLVSGGLIGSGDDDAGAGWSGFLDYEYLGRRFNVGLRSRYSHEDFRQLGSGDRLPPRRVDQASFGLSFYPYGRLGFLFVNTEAREFQDQQAVSANYSLPIGPGSLLINALHTLQPDQEFALAATYSLPLGSIRSLATTAQYRERGSRAGVQYRRGRGASDIGPTYRLASEVGDDARAFDGTLRYDAQRASAQLDAVHADGDTRLRANLSGSLAYVDGRAGLSRRLGRAFGMVALPGLKDVTVYLENREAGRTDDQGYLLLPQLSPYLANRVRVNSQELPLNVSLDQEEHIAVPYERSGVGISFAVRRERTALATLTDAARRPLPAGLELAAADGQARAQVADDGLAYVTSEKEGPLTLESAPGQPRFRCALPPLPDQPMSQLGEIRCR